MEHLILTTKEDEMLDITQLVREDVRESGIKEGIVIVYVPHTTAGVTINENADPDVVVDLKSTLRKVFPKDINYRHLEGNSHSHIKASLVGSSCVVIIEAGKLKLGIWQGIFFCEFDGPRRRKFYTKILS
ncbi:MAG: YjbQ family protein [Acholeplasmataceae bacterium]|jgi:secondary thiamine-phosphate synthase enzyme|nr:YjbQ family protein [Acholeplasmataceae bacterium]